MDEANGAYGRIMNTNDGFLPCCTMQKMNLSICARRR